MKLSWSLKIKSATWSNAQNGTEKRLSLLEILPDTQATVIDQLSSSLNTILAKISVPRITATTNHFLESFTLRLISINFCLKV